MKAGRWLLLVIPPVAFGITGMLHLVAAGGGSSASGEFEKIMRHADLWIAIHIVQIAIICLLGGTVLVLVRGLRSRAATLAAGGAAFALRGHVPTAGIVLLGAGAAVFAIDHAAPFGPVGMALFLAGSIVAELGRKAAPGDAGGGRDPARVLRSTRTA